MIAIVSAIWKRRSLTRIFLKAARRYRRDFGIETMVAGSEGNISESMCLDAGVGYVEISNEPLSNKWNTAMAAAQYHYKPDAFIILGSDDFMNSLLLQRYLLCVEEKIDIVGFRDCYFYDVPTKRAAYWPGYTVKHRRGESIGMGRMLSRKAYMKLKERPWSRANAGLDWVMTQRLKKHKDLKRRTFSVKDDNYILVDVKGFGNFCSIGQYDTEPIDPDVFNSIPEFTEIKRL